MLQVFMSHWSQIVRCLLVIAAWQGPLPVLHSHGSLAHASVDARAWLADHMAEEHADVAASDDVHFGWHVHFAMPESDDDSPELPTPLLLQDVVVGSHIADWTVSASAHAGLDSWVSRAHMHVPNGSCSVVLTDGQRARISFFSTFAPDMPLPVRLGVLRC